MHNTLPLFDSHGSDKGGSTGDSHRYGAVYGVIFAGLKDQPVSLLEIGIGGGGSVCGWLDYFSSARIYAIERWLEQSRGKIPTDHPRLIIHEGEATAENVFGDQLFDIIIDDADHVTETQVELLRAYWKRLVPGGIYVIEDLFVGKLPWGGESSEKSRSWFWNYSGYAGSPQRNIFPIRPQDLFFLNRRNMPADIAQILDRNEYFFTISSISPDGGLHMMLVIRRTED